MANLTAYEITLKITRGNSARKTESFPLPLATESAGLIRWKPGSGLRGARLLLNGKVIARGAKLLRAGQAQITLQAQNTANISLTGVRNASLTLSHLDPLYPILSVH